MKLTTQFLLLAALIPACARAESPPKFLERELRLDGRYLNLPVKAGEPRRTLSVVIDGRVVRAFEVELAEGPADFWAFTEVTPWRGQTATLRLDPIGRIGLPEAQRVSAEHPPSPHALDAIRVDDALVDAGDLYHEPLRPQFHFTTRRGWLNDPNGLLHHAGEYHLFYQLQAFSAKSLNSDKAWGHAVSRDLVHWEELPVALYPGEYGGVWSGSTLVDHENVLGFQRGTEPAMIAFYTATGRSAMNPKAVREDDFVQDLAYSTDRGRTWTNYAGNPILGNLTPLNRDPLVFWHAPSHRWVMVLYVGSPRSNPGNHYTARVLNSENLKEWTSESVIDGFFDCPMLFELPLDGNAAEPRWVMHCANMKYEVGRFDGKKFTAETGLIDAHVGKVGESAYAPQVFRNLDDGRTVQMAWLYHEAPGARQMMTFPCELSLVTTANGPRLKWRPAAELSRLEGPVQVWRETAISPADSPGIQAHGRHLQLRGRIRVGEAGEVELSVRGVPIVYHAAARELEVRGYRLPVTAKGGVLDFRILVDETSLEIFADDGFVYLPLSVSFPPEDETIRLTAPRGSAVAEWFEVTEVKSIWPDPAGAAASPR
ncbi:MAG: sacC [Verrucomicrobia bacterium]|nr:sacC [Verrucomicrobiota bacterium]